MFWLSFTLMLLLINIHPLSVKAETNKDPNESNTVNLPPPSDKLDSSFRKALLKALTELENEDSAEAIPYQGDRNIEKASASALTIFAEESAKNEKDTITPSTEQANEATEKPFSVIVQKSDGIQGTSITTFEKDELDPLRDAEHIITSASSSFSTKNEARSLDSNVKLTSLNSIDPSEEKPETNFVKSQTYQETDASRSSSATPHEITSETYVTRPENHVKSSQTTRSNVETTTVGIVATSTEESEAKVEQVQFFSAPLVAAFTVHQDEQGQPKKVEPIFKASLETKESLKSAGLKQQDKLQPQQSKQQQKDSFSSLDLQKKQQYLEQQLQLLRQQQQQQQEYIFKQQLLQQEQFRLRNNAQPFLAASNPSNFNQLDPVFTEPDRSVVTKLATTEPKSLFAPVLNKFTPSDAKPSVNLVHKPTISNLVALENKPSVQQLRKPGTVSLEPSISFDPLIEAGKLPKNGQILPNKEARNFLGPLIDNPNFQQYPSLTQDQRLRVLGIGTAQQPNIINNGVSPQPQSVRFVQPNLVQNTRFINQNQFSQGINQIPFQQSQNTRLHRQESGTGNFLGFNQATNQFLGQQSQPFNRILTQESGTGNFINNNGFSIQPSKEPFAPQHEVGYLDGGNRVYRTNHENTLAPARSPNNLLGFDQNLGANTRFFRSSQENLLNQQQNVNVQHNPRFFRSNLEATLNQPHNFNVQGQNVNGNQQNTRFFRSNQDNPLIQPQQLSIDQPNNRFFQSTLTSPRHFNNIQQNTKVFRPSQETTSNAQNYVQNVLPSRGYNNLDGLLYNSGFGGKSNEDLNIVSKVLSLNHGSYDNLYGFRNVPFNKK